MWYPYGSIDDKIYRQKFASSSVAIFGEPMPHIKAMDFSRSGACVTEAIIEYTLFGRRKNLKHVYFCGGFNDFANGLWSDDCFLQKADVIYNISHEEVAIKLSKSNLSKKITNEPSAILNTFCKRLDQFSQLVKRDHAKFTFIFQESGKTILDNDSKTKVEWLLNEFIRHNKGGYLES